MAGILRIIALVSALVIVEHVRTRIEKLALLHRRR